MIETGEISAYVECGESIFISQSGRVTGMAFYGCGAGLYPAGSEPRERGVQVIYALGEIGSLVDRITPCGPDFGIFYFLCQV